MISTCVHTSFRWAFPRGFSNGLTISLAFKHKDVVINSRVKSHASECSHTNVQCNIKPNNHSTWEAHPKRDMNLHAKTIVYSEILLLKCKEIYPSFFDNSLPCRVFQHQTLVRSDTPLLQLSSLHKQCAKLFVLAEGLVEHINLCQGRQNRGAFAPPIYIIKGGHCPPINGSQ